MSALYFPGPIPPLMLKALQICLWQFGFKLTKHGHGYDVKEVGK